MSIAESASEELAPAPALGRILREWARIGVLGFGGPPAHIVLLRQLVVERERWIDRRQFEDAIAASGLIPGPASTQLAIYCAGVLGGRRGAFVGAAGFILPGFVFVVSLAAVVLAASPPLWILGAGAGAGAAVPTVAVFAGVQLLPDSLRRAGAARAGRARWLAYALAGCAGAALAGASVVLVLLASGLIELAIRHGRSRPAATGGSSAPAFGVPVLVALVAAALKTEVHARIAWMAFKVGALSYGGGFVVIPLMHADAVSAFGWMSDAQFLSAVAIGQSAPGPVTNTVAAVGWTAAGLPGAVLGALFAFAPSVLVIAFAGHHFERVRASARAQAFLLGSGPAALGAILGSCVPLATGLEETWQWVLLAAAAAALLSRRVPLVPVLLGAALVGVVAANVGAPIPR
ncbi:MAG: chromate efflux transporter [Patulibacter minatonensis]